MGGLAQCNPPSREDYHVAREGVSTHERKLEFAGIVAGQCVAPPSIPANSFSGTLMKQARLMPTRALCVRYSRWSSRRGAALRLRLQSRWMKQSPVTAAAKVRFVT